VGAHAHQIRAGDLTIVHPSVAATEVGASTALVRFSIENHGSRSDSLMAASTPVADRVQFRHNSGATEDPCNLIPISARDTVTIAPGKYEVLLVGLKKSLEAWSSFPMTLKFEHQGEVQIEVMVEEQ